MSTVVLDKKADLAGPGIGDYKNWNKSFRMTTILCSPRRRHSRQFSV